VEALLLAAAHELSLGNLQGRGGDARRLAHGGLGQRRRGHSDGGGLSLSEAAGLRMLVVPGEDDEICPPCSSVLRGFLPSLLER